ncbi:MAG: hypothetical protein LUH40_08000 [Clostridiales bacterium]|nr:hypothetical protein [Clostridiales bacterium]
MKKKLTFIFTTVLFALTTGITAFADSEEEMTEAAEQAASVNISGAFSALTNCVPALVVAVISILAIALVCIFGGRLKKKLDGSSASSMMNAFIAAFSASGIICLVFAFLTDGVSWSDMMHTVDESVLYPQFSDYYQSMQTAARGLFYNLSEEFTPFGIIIYYLLAQFVPASLVTSTSAVYYSSLLKNQPGLMMYLFIVILYLVLIYRLSRSQLRKNDLHMRDEVTVFLFMLSYPVIYCVEQGNITALSLALAMFFILYRNSESKTYRRICTAALAISAAITPFTLIFALLLFFDKGKKGIKTFLCICGLFVVLFLAPCFITGFRCALYYAESFLTINAEEFIVGNVSLANLLVFFGVKSKFVLYTVFILSELLALVTLIALPKTWQKLAAAVYIILNIPSVSENVTYLFILIPLVYLLSEKEHKTADWLYLLCFSLIVIPIPEWYYFDSGNFETLLAAFNLPYISSANELISLTAIQGLFVLLIYSMATSMKASKESAAPPSESEVKSEING